MSPDEFWQLAYLATLHQNGSNVVAKDKADQAIADYQTHFANRKNDEASSD